jgi:hypothetical protein
VSINSTIESPGSQEFLKPRVNVNTLVILAAFRNETKLLQSRNKIRAARLRDQWTTRATLGLPLDEREVQEIMETGVEKTLPNPTDSLPSAVMELVETTDDWLFSFLNLGFESADGESNKAGHSISTNIDETIRAKQLQLKHPLSHKVLYITNHLNFMMSEEDRQSPNDNEEREGDDEAMNIDEEEDHESLSQTDVSKVGIAFGGPSLYTPEDKTSVPDISTPSMTDIASIIRSSPDSDASLPPPGLLPSPKIGTGAYTCPQCTYSCRRMCDLR